MRVFWCCPESQFDAFLAGAGVESGDVVLFSTRGEGTFGVERKALMGVFLFLFVCFCANASVPSPGSCRFGVAVSLLLPASRSPSA